MQTASHSAISLFSGCGGLDLGLEGAGWAVLAQLECDSDCIRTLELHSHGHPQLRQLVQARIEQRQPARLRAELGLRQGELGLLAGGPPCQPFTTSGLRQALHDQRASSVFPAYLGYVSEFLPRALLIENVDGMLSAALSHRPLALRGRGHPALRQEETKGSFLRWLVSALAGLGYATSWAVAEVADYGVPQLRQRAILIGVRGQDPCFLPPATHGPAGTLPHRTLRDALASVGEVGPIQPLSDRKRRVYELIPPGGNWRDLPDAVRQGTMGAAYFAEGGRGGWWRRLDWDRPCPTILGMPDHSSTALIHPEETRCLSLYECAAVQTFPSASRFAGSPRSGYQQIGNAVPPVFAAQLGTELLRFLSGSRRPPPAEPAWRRASGNRRIGTHGWASLDGGKATFHLMTRPRSDHIWSSVTPSWEQPTLAVP